MATLFQQSSFAREDCRKAFTLPTDQELLRTTTHPIFEEAKFNGIRTSDYKRMKLAVRLASSCIRLPSFHKYVDTIVNGKDFKEDETDRREPGRGYKEGELEGMKDAGQDPVVLRYPDESLSQTAEDVASRADTAMRALAPLVDYKVRPLGGLHGLTQELSGEGIAQRHPAFKTGVRATIRIMQDFCQQLRDAYPAENAPFSLKYLRISFELARTLLHELAHALNWVVRGRAGSEVYYGNCRLSEAGSQLEDMLFGGIPSQHIDIPAVTEWPDDGMVKHYNGITCAIATRWLEQTGKITYSLLHRVDEADIVDLFRESF